MHHAEDDEEKKVLIEEGESSKKQVHLMDKLTPIAEKILLKKQREALLKLGDERIEWVKKFAEDNVLVSRKLAKQANPSSKG